MNQFSIKLNFTLSKLVGTIIVLGGLFMPGILSTDRVLLVGIGAAAIGVKQYFVSKSINNNPQQEV